MGKKKKQKIIEIYMLKKIIVITTFIGNSLFCIDFNKSVIEGIKEGLYTTLICTTPTLFFTDNTAAIGKSMMATSALVPLSSLIGAYLAHKQGEDGLQCAKNIGTVTGFIVGNLMTGICAYNTYTANAIAYNDTCS